MIAQRRPCAECPWRTDVAPGQFGADRFQDLAGTAEDLSARIFACHKSVQGADVVCAGFLERGAMHNMAIRMAYARGVIERLDRSGGLPLHADYRAMAIANGVAPDDPALRHCRGRGYD